MVKKKMSIMIFLAFLILIVSGCSEDSALQDVTKEEESDTTAHVSGQVEKSCISCHAVDKNGKMERIEYMRKSPEGWTQTINRMERLHGLKITDEERELLVSDLSKERGLAPEELEKFQYWMANKPSYSEADPGNESVAQSCISCHASGRFEAQRRSEEEWKNLKDFHLVMYPSIYLNHRHMDWPKEADKAIEYLAKKYKLESKVWDQWKGNEYDVSGKWKVVGFQGTKGYYIGDSEFKKADGVYTENKKISFLEGGDQKDFSGNMKVYTGYILRSDYNSSEKKVNGFYNVTSENLIKGDWSEKEDLGIAGEETYYKVQTEKPEIFHAEPKSWKKGTTNKVTFYGMNMRKLKAEDINLPEGLTLTNISAMSEDKATAEITVSEQAEASTFKAEKTSNADVHVQMTVFDEVDYIKITPSYGVARMGGSGPMNKASVQYVALAYSNGKDGQKETEDDLKIGPVKAEWSMTGFPEGHDEALQYLGKLDSNGLFTPREEGVNKEREFVQENVGSAKVRAIYKNGDSTLTAESHHISTVPDYVNNIH